MKPHPEEPTKISNLQEESVAKWKVQPFNLRESFYLLAGNRQPGRQAGYDGFTKFVGRRVCSKEKEILSIDPREKKLSFFPVCTTLHMLQDFL